MKGTTVRDSREATLPRVFQALKVVFTADTSWKQKTVILRGALGVGREGSGDDIVVEDERMSRRHARFEVEAERGNAVVKDLGSRNGTFVNGDAIGEAGVVLRSGDVVRMGGTLLVYRIEDEARPLVPASSRRMIGSSTAIQRVLLQIAAVARGKLSVLIVGETGTGKELIAEEIHQQSRRGGPFIAVNCAAIPRDLFESAVFGHRKGSFSGAVEDAEGYFVAADRGTLFLDEVGEMPIEMQAKLLRVLQTMDVTPVGATRARRVDVRIVAATNRPLRDDVAKSRFRADLLARLEGVAIAVPPLRERREDIVPLFEAFLARADAAIELSAELAQALVLHPWPLNVRELENAAARLAIELPKGGVAGEVEAGKVLPPVDTTRAPRTSDAGAPPANAPPQADLEAALIAAGGKVLHAASRLGASRQQIYRWIQHYGIDLARLRPPRRGQ